jgi:hypothetical protein
VGEIGFRYRPSAQADLAAHAARLSLLAADVSDVPPVLLERAAIRHARQSKFMPTAAELIAAAREESEGDRRERPSPSESDKRAFLHELAARYNANLGERAGEKEWYVTANYELKIRTTQAARDALQRESNERVAWNSNDERQHTAKLSMAKGPW